MSDETTTPEATEAAAVEAPATPKPRATKKKAAAAPAVKRLSVKQVRSLSGRPEAHRRTMRALGFTKNQQTLIHTETPTIRGMLYQVRHLVTVTEIEE